MQPTISPPHFPPRAPAPAADDDLVQAVARGEIRAFDQLYRRHAPRVHGLALALLRHGGAAEDLTQDVFLTLWRSAHAFDPCRGSVGAWLAAITRNLAVDQVRRRSAEARALASACGRAAAREVPDLVPELALDRIEADRLHRALDALPPEQRAAVGLTFLAGLPHAEVARAAGLPLGTVKGRVRLGLGRLRVALAAPTA